MRLLVVGAHAADFVWRAGGIIAKTKELGGEVLNLSLSYGERGESGNLWKEDPNRSIESVKEARHEMSTKASDILGCTYQCLDWGDYPMLINPEREAQLAEIIRDFTPNIILTHTQKTHLIQIIRWPIALLKGHVSFLLVQVYPLPLSVLILLVGFLLNHINQNYLVFYPILILIFPLFLI